VKNRPCVACVAFCSNSPWCAHVTVTPEASNNSPWCAHVTVTPEASKIAVFHKGTCIGLNG
jgi:hypothetical protein